MDILNLLLLCCVLYLYASAAESGFEAEVTRLLPRVRMSHARVSLVPRVLQDLQRVLQTRWPEAEVTPYGSILAGLGVVGSDIDFSAELPEPYPAINGVKSILDQRPELFQKTRAVPARIPIVKFIHAPTGHYGDLSFRNYDAITKTAWMKYLMNVDHRALDLTIIVRHWAKLHKPDQSRHGRIMKNFAIVSLVIFYLQQIKVLPPVTALQQNAQKIIIEEWNLGFDEIPYSSPNNISLYEMLGGFFQYYDKFDFENMIVSTFTGYPIQRSAFKNIATIPKSYTLYKQYLNNGNRPLNITLPVVIQDAFLHNINVATEMTLETLEKFKLDLKFAADAYRQRDGDDFLQLILESRDIFLADKQYKKGNVWLNSTTMSCSKICYDNNCCLV